MPNSTYVSIRLEVKIIEHDKLFNLFLCLRIVFNMIFLNQFLLKPLHVVTAQMDLSSKLA